MRPSLFLSLLLMAPMAATATTPDPADPRAPTAAPSYRSVFADLPTGVESGRDDWRAANARVADTGMGDMAMPQGDHPAPAPAADPHAHHHGHGAAK